MTEIEEVNFLKEVQEYATYNLTLNAGMLVNVYNFDVPSNPTYCGVGVVRNLEWAEEWMQYIVDLDYRTPHGLETFRIFACQCIPLRGRPELKVVS